MHRALALAAGLILGPSIGGAAPAEDAPASAPATVWLCGLSHDATRLHCVADVEPAIDGEAAGPVGEPHHPLGATAPPTAVVNGAHFPLDRRQRWTVDLISPFAGEPAWLALLARATLCHRTPACEAIVHLPDEFRRAGAVKP